MKKSLAIRETIARDSILYIFLQGNGRICPFTEKKNS